jgi:uncharacterized protein DUF6166
MKFYHGMRTEHGCTVVVEEDGEFTGLAPRPDLWPHPQTGYEWGYAGSGAAELALALAADVTRDDKEAKQVCQRLKSKLICGLTHEGWVLSENRIRAAIDAIEQEYDRPR